MDNWCDLSPFPVISCTNCIVAASSPAFDIFLSQAQQTEKEELGKDGCLAFRVSLLMPRFSFTLHSPLQMISLQLVILLRFIFHLWVCVSMCMPHVCRYLGRTGESIRSPTAEVEVDSTCPTQMPGIEPRSSVRAASAPNHLAVSPTSLQPQWALFSNETFSYYLFTSLLQQVLQDEGWKMCGTMRSLGDFCLYFSYKPKWLLWYSQGLSFKQYIIYHLSGGSSLSKWRPLSLYCNYMCFLFITV